MATFPSLAPVRREWEFPKFPTIDYEGLGGNIISFEFGSLSFDQPLSLIYELISETEIQLIRDHYLGQQSIRSFILPQIVIDGYQGTNIFLSSNSWIYDGEPDETATAFDLYDTTINLRSVR